MSLSRALLIAGIPSSGKTYFGEWLATHHGYLHIDDVNGNCLRGHGLQPAWEESLRGRDARPFIAALQQRSRPAVLNWDFPLDSLAFVGLLKHAGMDLWWFEADVNAARREHLRSGRDSLSFDTRVADVAAHRTQIDVLFRPHVLRVLSSRGEHMPPEAIYDAMDQPPG